MPTSPRTAHRARAMVWYDRNRGRGCEVCMPTSSVVDELLEQMAAAYAARLDEVVLVAEVETWLEGEAGT